MTSKGSLLRNIRPSGGLFTENILLRLRDNPEQFKIGKIQSFIVEDTKEERKRIQDEKINIFEWCKDKWDEISPIIDTWTKEELVLRWLMPFFYQFGYVLEEFKLEMEEHDDMAVDAFTIDYQTQHDKNPYFHFIDIKDDFDSKNKKNPQNNPNHNICQQFINSIGKIKWLFLSNGKILRILTKYYHTYSKGYIEFDLENIFANRDIVEFNTLYSIVHLSRYKPEKDAKDYLIDYFQEESNKEGVKIGDSLRDNIREAIDLLGNELIDQNNDFKAKVSNNEFDTNEYYAELLRIIYRILFVFYAEQREMLPGAGSLYFEEFSLSSIRSLAEKPIKGDKNYDLWSRMFLTFELMRKGNDFLVVPCYNGGLFKDERIPIILNNSLKISNDMFLKFIRLLTTSKVNNVLQRINFLEISEEEIGAIYESLLDYKPIIDRNVNFSLVEGTERKSTGSYYTPKELIDILIRTTLQPLVEDKLKKAGKKKEEREKAILDLKVCDPACGGGTFLLAVLDYLGKILAEIRSDSDIPSENELRKARREILQHCIYAVDMNPLAVELVKISLWLRACVKNKPLNFLDNHIKCGNSLIGIEKEIELKKIKPNAFTAIKGSKQTGIDDENIKLQNMARKWIENEKEAKTTSLFPFLYSESISNSIVQRFEKIINIKEDNPQDINKKELAYREAINQHEYLSVLRIADIYTSAYFWPLSGKTLDVFPTIGIINQIKSNVKDPKLDEFYNKVKNISIENHFFHWFIEFPEVFYGERNGFDCILTNPPWDILLLNEKEFFLSSENEISSTKRDSDRKRLIFELKDNNPKLYDKYKNKWINLKKYANYLKESGFYNLSAVGRLNSYQLFIERCHRLISPEGYVGIIVPTGIITNYYMQDLFQAFVEENSILSLFDFENKKGIFDIHRMFRFSLLSLGGTKISQETIPMMFYTLDPKEVQEPLNLMYNKNETLTQIYKKLSNNHKLIVFEREDFSLFNPNTLTCPIFTSKMDYCITKKIYQNNYILKSIRKPIFTKLEIHRMFNISDDSKKFILHNQIEENNKRNKAVLSDDEEFLPIYESKFIWHYDHRFSTFENVGIKDINNGNSNYVQDMMKEDKNYSIMPRYWIDKKYLKEKLNNWNWQYKWFLAIRLITNATNQRTCISTIIPYYPSVNSLNLILGITPENAIYLTSLMNTFVFDYIVRQKLCGTNLNQFIIEQLPIIDLELWKKNKSHIIDKCIELIYTNFELNKFAEDIDYQNSPFKWNSERRFQLKAEIDAFYAHMFKLNRCELEFILESFPLIKKSDVKNYGEYKTKKVILKLFDDYKGKIKFN